MHSYLNLLYRNIINSTASVSDLFFTVVLQWRVDMIESVLNLEAF